MKEYATRERNGKNATAPTGKSMAVYKVTLGLSAVKVV